MTECERILKKGVINEDFLKEEVICDFLVDTKRKKLWTILLDMLVEFDQVCKRHNLTYFMIYGSLLGTVRHKGFIPWDDDIDVAMPREDYEKFIKLGEEFSSPLFLQTPYTDKGYFYTPARIRNSNTTAVVEMFKYAGFNQGIWLSVFPLDRWDDNGGVERYEEIRRLVKNCSTYMRIGNPHLDDINKERVAAYHGDPMRDYEEIQRLAQSCKDPDSKYVMTAVITQGSYPGKLLNASAFEKAIPMEFEGIKVMVPSGFDHLLRVWYGDYMQLPPMEKRGIWHAGTVFDADISYKDYLHKQGIEI
jgi:lipopolysaccharide cholinephosphotransferase